MNEEKLIETLNIAQKIANQLEEQYRVTAFELASKFLLNETFSSSSMENIPIAEEIQNVPNQRPVSLSELLRVTKVKKLTDKCLICSYYLYKYKNVEKFNVNQIKSELSNARHVIPGNTSDILNSLITKGLLATNEQKIDGLKGYYITTLGEDEVEKILSDTNE